LIRALLDSRNVEHIYALVRGPSIHDVNDLSSDEDAYNRVVKSMNQRLINVRDISDKQRLTVWNCNLSEDQLGLSNTRYQELCNNSTAIIHNAWMLDFNKAVMEFDNTCIKPSYTLLRIASTGDIKQFMFVSSITSASNAANSAGVVEEKPVHHQEYGGYFGYGQSKLVTERISIEYAKRFNVPVTISRVGQVAGDSINGVWNQNVSIA
jgi:thioester reductase-like protein